MRHSFRAAIAFLAGLAVAACATQPGSAGSANKPAADSGSQSSRFVANPTPPSRGPRPPLIIQGSGELTAVPKADDPAAAAQGNGNGFQLNFVDTDISAVVGAVLGDGLNLPYVVDSQVKGTMTLQASRPLNRDEVLSALEAALRVQGAALVDVHGVYHVVPSKDASRNITSLQASGHGGHGYGIYVVPLQYVSAAEMEKVLQPFAPDGGIVRVDEARNLLLLAGTGQEITTLLNVIKTFDVDWLAGMSFGLYPLEYVDAKTLAGELGEVFTNGKSPISGVVRLVPMTRLNALMVVTPQPKYLKDVEDWIHRLDLGSTTPGRRIYVYDVQNGKADDLASSLSRILSLSYDSGAVNRQSSGTYGSSGTSGLSSFGSSRQSMLGTGSTGLGNTMGSGIGGGAGNVAPLTSGSPMSGSTLLAGGSQPGSGGSLENASLKIVPNADNNSLLIFASPSEFAVIDAALKQLDVLPIQVLIEASIAEVTLTDQLQFGLQWSYQSSHGPLVFSEASSGRISQQFPGLSYLYSGSSGIQAVLNSIQTLTDVRVISAPKLVVLNNHDADLQVGDQVPITVQTSVSTTDANAPVVSSIQMQDTGVILHVTPRANKSGQIILDVDQEVSNVVATTTSNINSPTIQQRKISTTVAIHDGETVALGGLISDSRSKTRDGIPFLRQIPVLGNLFGSTNKQGTRTELIVLLTPRVIRSPVESEEVMSELETEFRGLRKDMPALIRQPPEAPALQIGPAPTGQNQPLIPPTVPAPGTGQAILPVPSTPHKQVAAESPSLAPMQAPAQAAAPTLTQVPAPAQFPAPTKVPAQTQIPNPTQVSAQVPVPATTPVPAQVSAPPPPQLSAPNPVPNY